MLLARKADRSNNPVRGGSWLQMLESECNTLRHKRFKNRHNCQHISYPFGLSSPWESKHPPPFLWSFPSVFFFFSKTRARNPSQPVGLGHHGDVDIKDRANKSGCLTLNNVVTKSVFRCIQRYASIFTTLRYSTYNIMNLVLFLSTFNIVMDPIIYLF